MEFDIGRPPAAGKTRDKMPENTGPQSRSLLPGARRILTALPVFNEAAHIAGVLDQVRHFCPDIAVVDDGSTDATPEILAAQTDVRVIIHETNLGYGASLKRGLQICETDLVAWFDADPRHRVVDEAFNTRLDAIVEACRVPRGG